MNLSDLLKMKKIFICCGTGGVGKTTTSASLALSAALQGKSALVITIDPAKRLATSLGMKTLDNNPHDLTALINEERRRRDLPPISGRFSAVIPDTAQTFEKFVRSIGKENDHVISRILKTSIYKIFAQEFSGAHEYMAMEKLFEIVKSPNCPDIIVLDTPPSAHTTLFLEAPNLLAGFFEDNALKWISNPGKKLFATGFQKLLSLLEKLTGSNFISDLVEFSTSLFSLKDRFLENLSEIDQMLHSHQVSFLVVSTPERVQRNDTKDFLKLLQSQKYPFGGFIINRVMSKALSDSESPNEIIEADFEKLKSIVTLSEKELSYIQCSLDKIAYRLQQECEADKFLLPYTNENLVIHKVSEQIEDVHSLGALYEIANSI